MSFAAMSHLSEGLCLNASRKFSCFPVGTGVPTVFKAERQSILPLKALTENKAWRYHGIMCSAFKEFSIKSQLRKISNRQKR
jgi:hypothetical protein